ncbi:hypothetical protein [Arhodomonas sp. SL1]|uniref:hypothetical protein n=1 Tax=Arhodomonas sp. SL1 TaxID=3425691 RepID=UPI003F8836C2
MPPLQHIARIVLDICLLRRGPQDLPASTSLLGLAIAASALVGYPTMRALPEATGTPGMDVIVGLVVTFAFAYGLLQAHGLGNRLVQTASALFATDVVISAIALVVLTLVPGQAPVASLALLVLVVWNVAIVGHIFRHALDTGMSLGVAWALALMIGSGLLLEWLHA